MTKPPFEDIGLDPDAEVAIRQELTLVALGKVPADVALRVGRLLDVSTRTWRADQEIVMKGRRIAYVGDAGTYPGEVAVRVHEPDLAAVPGLGEVHKHIESSHLTPEYEAALVLPRGNTWTCEASHEFSNVNGAKTLEFWLKAREAGSPLKIFPLPGSAVPPTGYEHGGGHLGYDEQKAFMSQSLMTAGLDEVMDWPGVWDSTNPSYDRLWGMIRATFEKRGVVEGHAAGIRDMPTINAFAAAGLASDHEAWTPEEFWDKLTHGLFMELRPHSLPEVIKGLLDRGLADWSQIALTTDDRSASDTLKLGATDHNVRLAIEAGLRPRSPSSASRLIPPAICGSPPGWHDRARPLRRYRTSVERREIRDRQGLGRWQAGLGRQDLSAGCPADRLAGLGDEDGQYRPPLTANDFAIAAEPGRQTMQAAVLRPFHWTDDFLTFELSVKDGEVQRDESRNITKFAIVDRFSGKAAVSKMFWLGCGPRTEETALACSMAHDKHNIWCTGSSDEAMALAVNAVAEIDGGWALVSGGKVLARVRYEVAGLMTCRPAEVLHEEMQALYAAAETIDWMFEPSFHPRWSAGFPERLAFATLTCAPWRWVLVAPSEYAPQGLVNVQNGKVHPVVF